MRTIKMLLAFFLLAGTAFAGTVTLTWSPPTTYTDGTTILPGDITKYRVYRGTQSGVYTVTSDVTTTTAVYTLPTGTYCWVVTAIDKYALESNYSNEICRFLPRSAPNAPVLQTITLSGVYPSAPLTYGAIAPNVQKYMYLTLQNPTPATQTVDALAISGTGFSVNPSLPITLLPNSSKKVRINFGPNSQTGFYTAAVYVATSTGEFAVPLSGVVK